MDTTITNPVKSFGGLDAQRDILMRGKFSKSHLYNLLSRHQFPKPCLVIGSRFTRWSTAEVDQWFANPTKWISEHAVEEVSE